LARRSEVEEVDPVVRFAGKACPYDKIRAGSEFVEGSARATLTSDASGWPEKTCVYLDSFVPGWR
jgi:hypothetical protein